MMQVNQLGQSILLNEQIIHAQCRGENREVEMLQLLHQYEQDHRYVIYVGGNDLNEWTRRCIRQADRILLCADGGEPELSNPVEEYLWSIDNLYRPKVELILLHPERTILPKGTMHWLRPRPAIHQHHHIRKGKEYFQLDRLLRYLTGRCMGLVLSGGGARGLAHIGAYRAFQEAKIPIDYIAGSSFGGLIAYAIALYADWQLIHSLAMGFFVEGRKKLFDYTAPILSLLGGKFWAIGLREIFGRDTMIEDLWTPAFCIATNLTEMNIEVIDKGPIWSAIRASVSIPGIVPPISGNKQEMLVDGAVLNNLPVDVMRPKLNGGKIFALDVGSHRGVHGGALPDGYASGWALLLNNWRKKSSKEHPDFTIAEVIFESIMLAGARHSLAMLEEADYPVSIDCSSIPSLKFELVEESMKLGYLQMKRDLSRFFLLS
jgi:predicted acylesterase/phospholipase RssA